MQVLQVSRERDPKGCISFDDMVYLPVSMGWVSPQFDLVVCDECQDMSMPQLLMLQRVVKPSGRICVIGDDAQALYGFRGAAADGMDIMKEDLDAVELGLTTTYRCPKKVVAMAAKLVPDYRAADTAPEGVVETLSVHSLENRLVPGDAVLSRFNAPLMPLCLKLLKRGVRARIEGRDIGKTLMSVVEKLRADDVSDFMEKVEAWGQVKIEKLSGKKDEEAKIKEVMDQVDTLLAVAEEADTVADISSRLDVLFVDGTAEEDRPSVFMLLQTFFYRPKEGEDAVGIDKSEEANIYYVALTRTKKHLVLVV
jgi:hypothetical protein